MTIELTEPLLDRILAWRTETPGLAVIGLCGAQGSGKSTLVARLASGLAEAGLRVATLSLDDLYLPRAGRLRLAGEVHPLFATRGVPGTHDIALGLATLDALARGEAAPLPRFDKGADEPLPAARWPRAPAHCDVLLFEGWCLGAAPQHASALAEPVNDLERDEDPAAVWRSHVNAALAGPYQQLWAWLNRLVLLAAPGWEVVAGWREQAEVKLRDAHAARAMSPAEIARFVQHYERLTRWILTEMPGRADVTARLGPDRSLLEFE